MWRQALERKFEAAPETKPFGRPEYDNLLGHWSATTDQPAAFVAEDLIAAYPEAKVVLVERDVDRWYKSFSETVINGVANPFIPLICLVDKVYIGQMSAQTDLIAKHIFHIQEPRVRYGILNNPEFFAQWREKAKDVYIEHNEKIKRITPKERLLVFKLDEGWEPLCNFLGRPVPDVPFPRGKRPPSCHIFTWTTSIWLHRLRFELMWCSTSQSTRRQLSKRRSICTSWRATSEVRLSLQGSSYLQLWSW